MVTAGKKLSSAVTVACGWLLGSVVAQLLFVGAASSLLRRGAPGAPAGNIALFAWLAPPMPLVIVIGGTAGIGLLRRLSGWPKLPLPKFFVLTLAAAVFGLAVLPLGRLFLLALLSNLLAVAMATLLAWRAAAGGSLGTHLFPGSSLDSRPAKPNDSGRRTC